MNSTIEKEQCSNRNESLGNVCVVRHAYNDWNKVEIPYEKISNFHWDNFGPDCTKHKQSRIYCYVPFDFACENGLIRHPKRQSSIYDVKVCVVESKTCSKVLKAIKNQLPEKPEPMDK